ncbi:MAG: hypothetical protein ACLQG5_03835 [Methanobacterium sp.]|jgi:hypothetical protein
MNIEEKWVKNNWSIEEIDKIEGIYYITFWIKEDLKKFLNECFKNDVMYTFSPPYSVACNEKYLKILIKKITYNQRDFTYTKIPVHPQIKLL